MLAQLRSMPKKDAPERKVYDYAHFQAHLAIVQALRVQKHIVLVLHQIWPVPDFRQFLQRHQALHDDMNRSLLLPRTDLTVLDEEDEAAKNDWSWRNYEQHLAVNKILKLP